MDYLIRHPDSQNWFVAQWSETDIEWYSERGIVVKSLNECARILNDMENKISRQQSQLDKIRVALSE